MTPLVGSCIRRVLWPLALFVTVSQGLSLCSRAEVKKKTSVYSLSTVVVYNTNVPESRELATFYAEIRGIDPSNIVALTCPDRESISRKEYEETIAKPLRDASRSTRSSVI